MKTQKITLSNVFHGTETVAVAKVLPSGAMMLSKKQAKRTRGELCGSPDCCCCDIAGERPSNWVEREDGNVILHE